VHHKTHKTEVSQPGRINLFGKFPSMRDFVSFSSYDEQSDEN
jgi:hypothetical protein